MLTVQEIETSALEPWEKNPRLNDHAVDAVAKSVETFGFNVPILCDENMKIIAGHTRWKAAKKLDMQHVPVIVLSMPESRRNAFAIADNKTGELADWDLSQLRETLEELHCDDIELSDIGFSDEDLRALLNGASWNEDDVPDVPHETKTHIGELFQLGKHRLLCGDSTRSDDISVLIDGQAIDLVFAGPPCFNQKLYAHWEQYDAYLADMRKALQNSCSLLKNGAIAVWHVANDSSSNHDLGSHHSRLLEESGLIYVDTIAWLKSRANYSTPRNAHIRRNHFYYPAFQWEALLVFRDPGGKMPKMTRQGARYMSDHQTNVWQLSPVANQIDLFGHPAVSPVELPYRAIQAYTGAEAMVFDPFGGSGTTLMAAEKAGRTAFLIERMPAYCDQIINRWETMTHEKAKLLSDRHAGVRR